MTHSNTKPRRWTIQEVNDFLPQRISPIPTSAAYRLGLLAVATSLVLLQAIYLAMVALAGYLTWTYIVHLPAIFAQTRVNALTLVLVATPVVVGATVTFFLLKPLLAKAPALTEIPQLRPEDEPVLFAFVERICQQLGAPVPARIDIDLRVNAAASLRRGWRSLFSNDLVLTLGLPLAVGMDVCQFGSVIAHEFGHFSQHVGMKLYFLIVTIRHWFARVAWARDEWDEKLDALRKEGGWRTKLIMNVAWATVQGSRLILRGLCWCANIVSAWFSRHMEYDADRHAAALLGGVAFEAALKQLPVIDHSAARSWEMINRSWRGQLLCDDFARLVSRRTSDLSEETRCDLVEQDLALTSGKWETHPATSDRISRIRQTAGVAAISTSPAEVLFADFDALSRKITLFYYHVNLGDALSKASLTDAEKYVELTRLECRRTEAIETYFFATTIPWRWFQLPAQCGEMSELRIMISEEDASDQYRRLLDQSLDRYSALQFVRAGGRVNPDVFDLSSSDLPVVEAEERESRDALHDELYRVRNEYMGLGYILITATERLEGAKLWRTAYDAIAASQEQLLDIRRDLVALNVVSANSHLLSAAVAAETRLAQSDRLRTKCGALTNGLSDSTCPPLDPDGEAQSIGELLLMKDHQSLSIEELASRILERADYIGGALLGELCAMMAESSPKK